MCIVLYSCTLNICYMTRDLHVSMDFLFTEALGIIAIWNYVRKSSCLHLWCGFTFQLLPLLYLIKPHNAPLSRTGFDLNMCYFYFNFNRKLFIQHINHKVLQNVRLYHATIIKLHSVVGRFGSLLFYDLAWLRTPPSGYQMPYFQEDSFNWN